MTVDCRSSGGNVMLLSCSGGSNTGQMANQAAVELTKEGFGKMYCLAGVGGRLSGFIRSAKDVEEMIVIDGCEIGCAKAVLETAGVQMKKYLVVTELGIEKNKNFDLDRGNIDKVKDGVKAAFGKSLSPSAMPRMSGTGGCGCCGQ